MKTLQWQDFGRTLMTYGTARAQRIMDKSKDDQFMQYFLKLCEYFQSKAKTDHAVTVDLDFGLSPAELQALQDIPAAQLTEALRVVLQFLNKDYHGRTEES